MEKDEVLSAIFRAMTFNVDVLADEAENNNLLVIENARRNFQYLAAVYHALTKQREEK